MPDVFISYAKQDYERARLVADALSKKGWSVWWDPTIAPGQTWAQVIEEQIKAAKCVVVLWTETSVSSRWVRKEARFGLNRDILIPALIDDVELPFEFEDVEAARLTGWNGEPHPEFTLLTKQVMALAGAPQAPATAKPTEHPQAAADRHRASGQAYIEGGDPQRGIAELEQALRGFEASAQWSPAAAVLDVILQLMPDSIAHRQKRVEIAARSTDKAEMVHAMLELAEALQRTGAPERARITYQQILEQEPGNAEALVALGARGATDAPDVKGWEPPAVEKPDQTEVAAEAVPDTRIDSDQLDGGMEATGTPAPHSEKIDAKKSRRKKTDQSATQKPKGKQPAATQLTTSKASKSGTPAFQKVATTELTTKTRVVFAATILAVGIAMNILSRSVEFRASTVWRQILIGAVAIAVIRAKRLPYGLWPTSAQRTRLSPLWALVPIAVTGTLFWTAQEIGRSIIPEFPSNVVLLAGVVAWTLSWGKSRQRPSGKWYGLAAGAALLPIMATAWVLRTRIGVLPTEVLVPSVHYWAIPAICGALVTSELVFRRMLIGPTPAATLRLVIGSAVVSMLWVWVGSYSLEGFLFESLTIFPAAMVAGSLYVLSGSLLVSAVYSGLFAGAQIALTTSFYDSSLDGGFSIFSYSEIWRFSMSWPLPFFTAIFAVTLAYWLRPKKVK